MKITIYSLILIALFIGGVMVLNRTENNNTTNPAQATATNISVVNAKQIIEINAKGGYYPRSTNAKANIPTTIKIKTNGTFDCSAALTIPSIKNRTFLPPSGETAIEIPAQAPGTTIQGVCAMGMYSFAVRFN